jgi:phosphoribosyl 1,2-cyclic phosphodiesterase
MIEFAVLGSGSKGNCTLVKTGDNYYLIDSGLSCKKIVERLEQLEVNPHSVNGIFVTHEHSDHIMSVHTFSKRYSAPVFCTEGTFKSGGLAEKKVNDFVPLKSGKTFSPDGFLDVFPCPVSHDAADPVCYIFYYKGVKFSHVTDLGYPTELVLREIQGSDAFVVEFNHDPQLLKMGEYPWPLKQRILSRAGHLSNSVAADLIEKTMDTNTSDIVLAHLSEDNNHPDIALMTMKQRLNGSRISLTVAKQHSPTKIFNIKKK